MQVTPLSSSTVKVGPHRHETVRADRLRGPAYRQGFVLMKSRLKAHLALPYGLYRLVPTADTASASALPTYRIEEVEALIRQGAQEITEDQPGEKACSACGCLKPLTEFWQHRKKRDGHQDTCKPCAAARYAIYHANNRPALNERGRQNQAKKRQADPNYSANISLRCKFGLTLEQYEAKLAAQGGVCAICGVAPIDGAKRFPVDHDRQCCPRDRTCGKCVRDILCPGCNNGTGITDDPVLLREKASYIETWRVRHLEAGTPVR